MKTTYRSTGIVLGNYWGGGQGAYAAKRLANDDLNALIAEAERGVQEGWLDAGMGYESLIGAKLNITKITTVEIKGKSFTNEEHSVKYVGKLSTKQKHFLSSIRND